MLPILPNGLRTFERCAKPWADYSIYYCRRCESHFGACCDEEQVHPQDLHWLVAVCRETRIKNCPICTAPVDYDDIIGVVVGRDT